MRKSGLAARANAAPPARDQMPAHIEQQAGGGSKHGLHHAVSRFPDRMRDDPANRRRDRRRQHGRHRRDLRTQAGLQRQSHGDDPLGGFMQDQPGGEARLQRLLDGDHQQQQQEEEADREPESPPAFARG